MFSKFQISKGISLIELGLVMVIISLSLAPIVRMIGGSRSSDGEGTAVRVVGQKSKELIAANSLIDKTLSSDYSVFNCGNSFTPSSDFPAPNKTVTLPNSRCANKDYSKTIYYQWSVFNPDSTDKKVPKGNHYYTATLNVYSTASGGTPTLSIPFGFYWNESGDPKKMDQTGIALVLDQSRSMGYGATEGSSAPLKMPPNCKAGAYPGSPFLRYRYANGGYTPSSSILLPDISNNNALDIVTLRSADDKTTPWLDNYIKPSVNGTPSICTSSTAWNNAAWRPFFDNSAYTKGEKDDQGNSYSTQSSNINKLCSITGDPGGTTWNQVVNDNLSRMEVARSSLLAFLLSMEGNYDLYENTKMAFLTYSSMVYTRVPLTAADSKGKYPNLRKKLTWINRSKGNGSKSVTGSSDGPILPDDNTDMYRGVVEAAKVLYQDPDLSNRIIFMVGDGQPQCFLDCPGTLQASCPGQADGAALNTTTFNQFKALGKSLGDGSFNQEGVKGNSQPITIFSLGLLKQNSTMSKYLGDALADQTPGGQYLEAKNIGDVQPFFEQLQYQIQRIILLNKSSRYQVDFD